MNQPKKQNWPVWYFAVILMLVLQIVLYFQFTQYFK